MGGSYSALAVVVIRTLVALLLGFGRHARDARVLLVVQPGTTAFNLGAVFVLVSVLFYALMAVRVLSRTGAGNVRQP